MTDIGLRSQNYSIACFKLHTVYSHFRGVFSNLRGREKKTAASTQVNVLHLSKQTNFNQSFNLRSNNNDFTFRTNKHLFFTPPKSPSLAVLASLAVTASVSLLSDGALFIPPTKESLFLMLLPMLTNHLSYNSIRIKSTWLIYRSNHSPRMGKLGILSSIRRGKDFSLTLFHLAFLVLRPNANPIIRLFDAGGCTIKFFKLFWGKAVGYISAAKGIVSSG